MTAQPQISSFSLYETPAFSVGSLMVAKKKDISKQKNTEKTDFSALLYDVGKTKNKQSFIALFEYFAPRVKSFLIGGGLSDEIADEIAQETMLTVWHKAKSYNPQKAKASTWIFTIARNKKIDFFRKNSRETVVDMELDLIEDNAPVQSIKTQQTQEKEFIADALQTLPSEQADLIHKSFFEGKSHSEIAEETELPLGTIKSRIRLALERLRGEQKIKDLK